jgi:hypothetical protein
MWARVTEALLGCWLLASPFVFRHAGDVPALWWNDFLCGFLVLLFSLVSYSRRFRYAHLLTALAGCWLYGFGYFSSYPPAPAAQNHMVTGILLAMLAIIPNHASTPPAGWRPTEKTPQPGDELVAR